MKSILVVLVLGAFVLIGAGAGNSASGLRGTVLVNPSTPTCSPVSPCTHPAAHALLRFWRRGRVAAHTRTDGKGRFRIALRPRPSRVPSPAGRLLKPAQVPVTTDGFRRVTLMLDSGIR